MDRAVKLGELVCSDKRVFLIKGGKLYPIPIYLIEGCSNYPKIASYSICCGVRSLVINPPFSLEDEIVHLFLGHLVLRNLDVSQYDNATKNKLLQLSEYFGLNTI